MTDRNDPCPCGSGKKFKKCHGAGAAAVGEGGSARPTATGQIPTSAARASSVPTSAAAPTPAARPTSASNTEQAVASGDDRPFLVMTGRGVESEKADAERKKHLRRRIQSTDLRGTLVYNSGAFFKTPNPQDPGS